MQISLMASAEEVNTKMKLMYQHMEKRAQEISSEGAYACTVGTLTPTARFKEDDRVPSCTRYTNPSEIIKLSFKPTKKEEQVYEDWKVRMKQS
jgi:hypothetical protein